MPEYTADAYTLQLIIPHAGFRQKDLDGNPNGRLCALECIDIFFGKNNRPAFQLKRKPKRGNRLRKLSFFVQRPAFYKAGQQVDHAGAAQTVRVSAPDDFKGDSNFFAQFVDPEDSA